MYVMKEMKFPIFITLDESGVHSSGEQMYKLEIQDANLVKTKVEASDITYLTSIISELVRVLLNPKKNDTGST